MSFLGIGTLLILVAGALPLLFWRYPRPSDQAFRILILAGVALWAVPAVQVLLGGSLPPAVFQTTLPGGPWVAGLDSLSAWFVLLLCVVTAATTCFGVTYLAAERPHRNVAASHSLFALLVGGMLGVFTARVVLPFLLAWELMAVSAYFLMLFDHVRAEVRRAGMVYLIVTHAGTLALIAMFLLWGRSGPDLSFASLTPGAARLVAGGAPILLLALVGFGAKAGVFPLHFWLPGAHAAAPSHVSALLSGVMIKTGIYGLFRVLLLFGPLPPWWGWTLLLLGLVSALFGVRWALSQHDLKRALAYSSVDNIGIVLLGLGLGALGSAYQHPTLQVLGFTAALLHVMNHALFKSLLFLAAGAVGHATGTRQIDRLGGLVRAMPLTAGAFLLGSIAIVGLPGLNGFVGEWTLVRGLLAAGGTTGSVRFAGLGVAAMGLIGALTLACFLRLAGTLFLGVPRVPALPVTSDTPGGMGLGMALLATVCLVVGLLPSLAAIPAGRVAATLMPGLVPGQLASSAGASPMAITVLVMSLLLVAAATWALRRGGSHGLPRRVGPTWGCAFPSPTGRMQYTAASFSLPLTRTLDASGAASGGPGMPLQDSDRVDRVLHRIVVPVWERIRTMAGELRPMQHGRVTTYLQFIIGTVLVLLTFLFFADMGTRP